MLSFRVKFVQTDGQTTVQQYAPNLPIRVHTTREITFEIITIFFYSRNSPDLQMSFHMFDLHTTKNWPRQQETGSYGGPNTEALGST